jgi:hypothetical protein
MVGSSFPNYCPYHRYVHRPLEDCWVFQNWMQREYEAGRLALGEALKILRLKPRWLRHCMTEGKSQVEFCGMVDVTPQDALLAERPIGGQMELHGGRGSS